MATTPGAKAPAAAAASQDKDQNTTLVLPRSERRRWEGERCSAAGPLLMAERCPLELSLTSSLGTHGSSSSAGERTVKRRRRNVSALYAELRALLPNLPSSPRRRMNQEEILDAAMAHIKVLEDTAAVLEAYRGVRAPRGPGPPPPPERRRRPEVAVSGAAACFSARLPAAGPGALRRVLEALDRRGVEVLAATLARHGGGRVADAVVTVTVAAAPPEVMEMIMADIASIH